MPRHILHIVPSLAIGGAEKSAVQLIEQLSARGYRQSIISFQNLPPARLRGLRPHCQQIEVLQRTGTLQLRDFLTLPRLISQIAPDLIQSWMYHVNLLALLMTRFQKPVPKIVWNIRSSLYRLPDLRFATRQIVRLGRLVSARPSAIIYNSAQGQRTHRAFGFLNATERVILNGVDTDRFRPSPEIAAQKLFPLPEGRCFLGTLARFDSMKDFPNLLSAFTLLQETFPNLDLVLAGPGVTMQNPACENLINSSSVIRERVHVLGEIENPETFYSQLDLFCLASKSEGFPNVVAEAMSSGVPVVSTDVGAVHDVVGECGIVVPAENSVALARAVAELLANPSSLPQRGLLGRKRIETLFNVTQSTEKYCELYEHILL